MPTRTVPPDDQPNITLPKDVSYFALPTTRLVALLLAVRGGKQLSPGDRPKSVPVSDFQCELRRREALPVHALIGNPPCDPAEDPFCQSDDEVSR